MLDLEAEGRGVAFGDVAIHTRFSMSYASYSSMKLYYLDNPAFKSGEIEAFLRRYHDFSSVFAGNWVASLGVEVVRERFERLEASYHALQTLFANTVGRLATL